MSVLACELERRRAKRAARSEIRAVLKAGGSHSNAPSTAFTQAARRKAWRKRFNNEWQQQNDQLALAFLIEWLMRPHRFMLVEYLDFLGVKHSQGETDEDFCEPRSPDRCIAHRGARCAPKAAKGNDTAEWLERARRDAACKGKLD